MDDNIIGKQFGSLTVLRKSSEAGSRQRYECACTCGNNKTYLRCHIVSGAVKSCGCGKRTSIGLRSKTHGHARPGNLSPTFTTWMSLKARCKNPNNNMYKHYCARGITVCDRWNSSFEAFLSDMGEKPPGCSIDRIDNNLGYSPDNCKWSTATEQANNRRSNKLVTAFGVTASIADWSRRFGVDQNNISARLRSKKWSQEDAVSKPATTPEDLSGMTFGSWVVIESLGGRYWMCRCGCGTEKQVHANNLKSGRSKSCQSCGVRKTRERLHGTVTSSTQSRKGKHSTRS